MEVETALNARLFRFRRLVSAVARIDIAFEDDFAVGNGIGVDGAGLDHADGRALNRAGHADLVAALRQDHVVETGAGEQRAGRRQAEAHGDRHRLVVLVVLGDDLPHVRAGRDLERAHIAPAEVHAVVAEVRPAVEILARDHAVAGADRVFRLEFGVADGDDVLIDVGRVLDDHFLARGLVLADLDRRQRVLERVGELARAVDVVLPAEHLVDDVHVAEQVGHDPVVGPALDVVEQDGTTAVQVLLDRRDLQIRVYLDVGLDQVAFGLEPLERAPKVHDQLGRHARHIHFSCAHMSSPFAASGPRLSAGKRSGCRVRRRQKWPAGSAARKAAHVLEIWD